MTGEERTQPALLSGQVTARQSRPRPDFSRGERRTGSHARACRKSGCMMSCRCWCHYEHTVTIAPGVRVSGKQAPWSQRCHSCAWPTDHDDIKRLTYTRADGVPGSSYPMCGHCRPEQITRLERLGFVDIRAVGNDGRPMRDQDANARSGRPVAHTEKGERR